MRTPQAFALGLTDCFPDYYLIICPCLQQTHGFYTFKCKSFGFVEGFFEGFLEVFS